VEESGRRLFQADIPALACRDRGKLQETLARIVGVSVEIRIGHLVRDPEKLAGLELAKIFALFYGTERFIVVFTRSNHRTLP
jgi:hypothetical protein